MLKIEQKESREKSVLKIEQKERESVFKIEQKEREVSA